MVGDSTVVRKATKHLARAEALADGPQAKYHVRQAEQLLLTHDELGCGSRNSDLHELSP